MSTMSLILAFASPFDVARIAEIHMAAFGSNEMLQAQFPTPAVRAALKTTIEMKALADIKDPKTSVMVVRDVLQSKETSIVERELSKAGKVQDGRAANESNGKIISFAKWSHPVAEGEDYIEPPWVWPEGTATEVLENWTKKLEEAQEKVMGRTPCYRLNFIGTDPQYERRGAASLLLQWGLEQCRKDNTPVYLESTIQAVRIYERSGFVAVEKISLPIESIEGGGKSEIYTEIGLLYRP